MFLAAVIVAATIAAPVQRAEPRRQATATVRIIRAEPLHFADIERQQPQALRATVIRGCDGRPEAARLYEYQ